MRDTVASKTTEMAERIDPAVLASVCDLRDLCLSPDGKYVVYACRPNPILIQEDAGPRCALWMAEVGKEHSSQQLTPGLNNDYSPSFSPDGKYISFISDRPSATGSSAIYLLPIRGGEALPLTPTDKQMGVGVYKWRPDGKAIAYTSADEKSEARKQRDKADATVYDEDTDLAKLRLIQLDTKEIKTLDNSEGTVAQIVWNEAGTHIAYSTFGGPSVEEWVISGTTYHVVDVEKNVSKKLCHSKAPVFDAFTWHGDNIYWPGNYDPESDIVSRGIWSMSTSGKEDKPEVVAHGKTDCGLDARSRGTELILKVHQGLADVLRTLNGKEIYREKHDLNGWDVHVESKQFIVVVSHGVIGTPPEVYSIVKGKKLQLSEHNKDIAAKKIGRSHLCEYTNSDGVPIDGLYGIPRCLESAFVQGQPSPTIVFIHGGPYARVTDCFDLYFQFTSFLMSLGYLVLLPNYRGGTSHGHDYADLVHGDISEVYQDVLWLVNKGVVERRIDKERVAIMGWSLGGYLSLLAATRDDDFHFSAIVSGAGISDWAAMSMHTDIPSWVPSMSGKAPWESNDINDVQQRKCSPIYHMTKVSSPVLLFHGQDDTRTPKEQSIGFYRGLKARGVDATLVMYKGEGHGYPTFWKKSNAVDMAERLERFFEKHVKRKTATK